MSIPTTSPGFSPTTPAPDAGYQNAVPRGDNGTPLESFSFEVPNVGGAVTKTANYTALPADCGTLLSFNSASAVTLTLPATPPFLKWKISVQNVGAGTLTVSPNGLNIDGSATNITLATGTGASIYTDASNYFTERGSAGSAAITLTGAVTGSGSGSIATTLAATAVTPGSYTNVNLTVNAAGQVTAISNGTGGGGGVGGLFSGLLSAVPTISSLGLGTTVAGAAGFAVANVTTGVLFSDTGASSGLEGKVMAYPGVPFTATALFSLDSGLELDATLGFIVMNTLTGKAQVYGYINDNSPANTPALVISNWTVPATFSANVTGPSVLQATGGYLWLRFKDTGSAVSFYWSNDGVWWRLFGTAITKSGSFLGASGFNYFGIHINSLGAFGIGTVVQSWTLTTP